MKTSTELKDMAVEMSRLHADGNKAAKVASASLSKASRTAAVTEKIGKASPKDQRDIDEAVAMYEAAKTFMTPDWQDDKPPYAVWNAQTKTFDVRYW